MSATTLLLPTAKVCWTTPQGVEVVTEVVNPECPAVLEVCLASENYQVAVNEHTGETFFVRPVGKPGFGSTFRVEVRKAEVAIRYGQVVATIGELHRVFATVAQCETFSVRQ